MTNTRIIHHNFAYHGPASLDEALKLLTGSDVSLLAGGTDLINKMKLETAHPREVVYLGRLEELKEFSDRDGLDIGAMASMTVIERSKVVQAAYPCLYEAIHSVGGQQIRNMATLAGNIANASPAADGPPALMVLGAQVEIGRLGPEGRVEMRKIAVEDIFSGPGKTILEPGEMILRILVPAESAAGRADGRIRGSAFEKNARVKLDVAKASAAAFLEIRDGVCELVRVAAGSVAPVPLRAKTVESALKGEEINIDSIKAAAEKISEDIRPISDVRSTEKYRRQVMKVLVRDALLSAFERAKGGSGEKAAH